MAVRRLEVPADAPKRLDSFLGRAIPGATKNDVQRWLGDGLVKVNGKKASPTRRLVGGEVVEIDMPKAKPVVVHDDRQKGPPLIVLKETDALVVINKPADLVVEREPHRPSVVSIASLQFTGFSIAGHAEPGVVQRLDKDTTGCLVLAKTDAKMLELNQAFENKLIKKTYLALVIGEPPETGKLDTPYGRNPNDPRRYTSRINTPRRARLSWVKREQFEGYAMLEIDLDTGRTHQIRAQLADIGHSLLGDWLYGTREARDMGIGRIALHAWKLSLPGLDVEAPIPDDFRRGMGTAP